MKRGMFDLLTAIGARLPMSVGYTIADLLAPLHYYTFGSRRRAVLANLETILPSAPKRERRRTARRIVRSYNRMVFEFFRLPHLADTEFASCVTIEGAEHVDAALARGRGVIVTSCHIGNWELGAVGLAKRGNPVTAVAGVQFGRWLATDVRAAKERLAVATVSPEDGFRKLWRALDRNEIVALMVDGDVHSGDQRSEFFKKDTPWPAGPGLLAKRTGAPVVAGYCERLARGQFRIQLEPPLDPENFASAAALNAAIASTSSRHVATHIDQWCIFRPFWAPMTQPDEAESHAGAEA